MSTGSHGLVGSVVSLWRYPVKSMMGEELNAVPIAERGLLGDRAYALVDESDGKVVSAGIGRFGPYVRHGRTFASLPKDLGVEEVTLEQALELIAAKVAKGGKSKKAPAKKTPAKKTTAKKATKKPAKAASKTAAKPRKTTRKSPGKSAKSKDAAGPAAE